MNETIYLVVGAFLAGVIGVLTNRVSRYLEERNVKERVWRALKAEIIANQGLLAPFYYRNPEEWGRIPRSVSFDRIFYSELAGNIALLKNMREIVDYYQGIVSIETLYMKTDDDIRGILAESSSKEKLEDNFRIVGIDDWLIPSIEATYELGEELIQAK